MDQHMRAPAMSIHAPVGDEEGRMLEEVVAPEAQIGTDDQSAENELGGLVQRELARFREGLANERERVIWDDRLTSMDPASLSELGLRFGVSKERVRQLEARIRASLKTQLQQSLGDEIDFSFRLPEEEQ